MVMKYTILRSIKNVQDVTEPDVDCEHSKFQKDTSAFGVFTTLYSEKA